VKSLVRCWRRWKKRNSRVARFSRAAWLHNGWGRVLLRNSPLMSTSELRIAAEAWKRHGKRLDRVGEAWGILTPNVTVQGTRHLVAGTLEPIVGLFHFSILSA
jgi:hypothetical protein